MARSVKKKTKVKEGTVKRKTVKSASNKEIFLEEVPSSSYIVIDYPNEANEAEAINGSHYALRIGASNDGYVEISFNDGEWLPCRFGSGYCRFDWMGFDQGRHSLSARLVNHHGNIIAESDKRKCKVC
ncbi:MAG: hypothetical protein LBL16_03740 [Endomicrobium sp.]|jgi:hypothetical protein|nr:hypothetical protein [Endomicrobium sp.]